jgi:hypothetical protein
MRLQAIRIHADQSEAFPPQVELGGWFQGVETYLWFGLRNECIGVLSGNRLYRLAKAIVRHYEQNGG